MQKFIEGFEKAAAYGEKRKSDIGPLGGAAMGGLAGAGLGFHGGGGVRAAGKAGAVGAGLGLLAGLGDDAIRKRQWENAQEKKKDKKSDKDK